MTMAENPFMPWHWQAYLADTTHLTTIEHGAYDLLIGAMWLAGGVLPENDAYLMRVTKTDRRQWQRMKPTIMAFMRSLGDGNFTQNNVLDKLRVVRAKRAKASDSVRARWLKTKGLPDTDVLRTNYERNTIKNSKKEDTLAVQSSTQAQKESGSAEKQGGVAGAVEAIEVTPWLKGHRLTRKAG
jgi:uncharacterized protein YdaU (DUF1376 family)